MKDAGIRCGRCGTTKAEHRLANFADGPIVGLPALICPTAIFLDMWERQPDARPDLALFDALETAKGARREPLETAGEMDLSGPVQDEADHRSDTKTVIQSCFALKYIIPQR